MTKTAYKSDLSKTPIRNPLLDFMKCSWNTKDIFRINGSITSQSTNLHLMGNRLRPSNSLAGNWRPEWWLTADLVQVPPARLDYRRYRHRYGL